MRANLKGKRFGRLVVLDYEGKKHWRCLCDCGKIHSTASYSLTRGRTKSCGCFNIDAAKERATHRMCDSPEYGIWSGMIQRCTNSGRKRYKDYGGRGIAVCDRWLKFENFYADMGNRPSNVHTIERINSEGNYAPENCVWATQTQQQRNRRNLKLSLEKAASIRAARFVPALFLAQIYSVHQHTIYQVWNNKIWVPPD